MAIGESAWPISVRGVLWALFAIIVAHILYILFLEDRYDGQEHAATPQPQQAASHEATNSNSRIGSGDNDRNEDWKLASVLKDKSDPNIFLRVSTRARRGELGFQINGSLDASMTELVALARETDLMPTWNAYCAAGEVVRLASPMELWAWADFKFWPIPIPPMYVAIHATLQEAKEGDGVFLCAFESPPEGSPSRFDRSTIPMAIQQHAEMVVPSARAKLYPAKAASQIGGPRTAFEVQVMMDLSKLLFLGPVRHLHPPQWMVTTIVSVMMPTVWKTILKTVNKLHENDGGAIGARIVQDETGVYQRIRRATRQADPASRIRGRDQVQDGVSDGASGATLNTQKPKPSKLGIQRWFHFG